MMKPGILVAAAAFVLFPDFTEAKPAHSTKYTYYTVGGNSAESIYKAMLNKGPRVNGAKAYAATTATTRQDGKLMQSKSCRIEDYQLRLDFVIKLPRIRNEKALASADRERWNQFSAFLKKHEETHRSIWLECAAEMERKVRAIKAKSCDEADANAERLWEQTRAACSKKHDAFDLAEQKKLMKHPFVQLVYKRSSSNTRAAAAQ
jgi:predicted secreted Zn-dependent protease